ncbi:PREDICTED: uncharacterized protein LOC106808189 [Priapulus caudatus]|uniref:Uncharacterized protein LOC106808189 n=1 Tax=Priapulus caudatus TaxID=37621 RepID=A0ABM1E257_PRICU|nr:PREDICTED: uncharacterized protein LOC106808189 [Priapulus caudatus]
MSENILSAAKLKYNENVHVRVADVKDLVAAEGIYHANCMKKFFRDVEKAKTENKYVDLAMVWLAQELRQSADRGHVLELIEVRKRYEDLAGEAGIVIPASYLSRLATFKDRLSSILDGVYDFIVLRDQENFDRKTVMVPKKFSHVPLSKLKSFEGSCDNTIPIFRSGDDEFLSMVHVALKIRGDIQSQSEFKGVDVNENAAIDCVPTSLYMFIRLLIGGQTLLEEANDENDVEDTFDKIESVVQSRVLSIGQDIVFNVSGERKTSPKHVGLGLTLHQATRSKSLVEMFYNAGHIASYRDILRVDTALAEWIRHSSLLKWEVPEYQMLIRRLGGLHVSMNLLKNSLAAFVDSRQVCHNFQFWWKYIEMVNILLRFTRAQRDGLWELHLSAFRDMLPYFHQYDHTIVLCISMTTPTTLDGDVCIFKK